MLVGVLVSAGPSLQSAANRAVVLSYIDSLRDAGAEVRTLAVNRAILMPQSDGWGLWDYWCAIDHQTLDDCDDRTAGGCFQRVRRILVTGDKRVVEMERKGGFRAQKRRPLSPIRDGCRLRGVQQVWKDAHAKWGGEPWTGSCSSALGIATLYSVGCHRIVCYGMDWYGTVDCSGFDYSGRTEHRWFAEQNQVNFLKQKLRDVGVQLVRVVLHS